MRLNSELNLLWGNKASQRPERPRVEFKGVHIQDPVTDELKLRQQNEWSQRVAYVVAWFATILMGSISVGIFAGKRIGCVVFVVFVCALSNKR